MRAGGVYVTEVSRRASDVDAESGIETCDSDSATASVTSSEYAAAAAVATVPGSTSVRREAMTALSVDTAALAPADDDVEEFIRRVMVRPPPSPICLDDRDIAVVPPPIDCAPEPPPPPPAVEHASYSAVLPPLVEEPEDDATVTTSGESDGPPRVAPRHRPPPPPSKLTDTRRYDDLMSARTDLTTIVDDEDTVDENCNRVSADGDVAAAAKSSYAPVAAKRLVKTKAVNSSAVNGDVVQAVAAPRNLDAMKSATLPMTRSTPATTTTTTTRSASVSDDTTSRKFIQLTQRRFSGDTESGVSDSRRKTPADILKRFRKRDGTTSSTGFSWLPYRRSVDLKSRSDAESTATLPRRSKDSAARSKVGAGGKAPPRELRELYISLPTDFRCSTNKKLEQRSASDDNLLDLTDRRDADQEDSRSARARIIDASSDDEPTAVKSSETRAKAMQTFRDERGRLFSAEVESRIPKASSVACMQSSVVDSETQSGRSLTTSTLGRPSRDALPTAAAAAKRTTLTNLGATLPRLYRRTQLAATDDPPAASSQPPSARVDAAETCEDDVDEVRRSEFMSVNESGRPSPAADTTQRLHRSLTEQPASPLVDLLDFTPSLDDDDRPPRTAAAGASFDTFRGALKPMYWSDEKPSWKPRSLSVGSRVSGVDMPAYIDVRPPVTFLAAVVTDKRPSAAPVAAQRSANIISSTAGDQQRPNGPQMV